MKQLNSYQLLIALAVATIIIVGAKFSLDLKIQQDISKQADVAITQNEKIEQILEKQANDSKTRSTLATEERQRQINLTGDVKALLQQQGNLTQEQREELIVALQENVEAIPQILNALEVRAQEHQNQTELILQGLKQTGNASAQRGAIEVINELKENQELIMEALNITK